MKRIGMLGGMSWESSLEYYRLINEGVKGAIGVTHSAQCIMYSFDFDEIEKLQHKGDWEGLTNRMIDESLKLKAAGADFIAICTNTMHKMADEIEAATALKILHIATACADEVNKRGSKKILLLGTKFTMEGDFYRDKLETAGIEVLIPDEFERREVHDVIYHEFILGEIKETSKQRYLEIIHRYMDDEGIDGVVLGCTEIPLLIKQEDIEIEVYDTTSIHCSAIVDYAVS